MPTKDNWLHRPCSALLLIPLASALQHASSFNCPKASVCVCCTQVDMHQYFTTAQDYIRSIHSAPPTCSIASVYTSVPCLNVSYMSGLTQPYLWRRMACAASACGGTAGNYSPCDTVLEIQIIHHINKEGMGQLQGICVINRLTLHPSLFPPQTR